MMNEAERLELIARNPMRRVRPSRVPARKRVILSAGELKELFRPKHWTNSIAFAANIFAALTGARLGECLALRGTDIHDGYVIIQHSLGRLDGMKATKTGIIREVPLPRIVQRILQRLTTRNGDGFVFSRDGGYRPLYSRTVTGALRKALLSMGITAEEIKQRGLTFHGWRHTYNTILLHHGVPIHITQQLVGHRTDSSTDRYAAHQNGEVHTVRPLVETALQEYLA
jgi:integrase